MSDFIEVQFDDHEIIDDVCIKTKLISEGFDLDKPILYYDDVLHNCRVYRQRISKEDN